jgi:hypothetical protein
MLYYTTRNGRVIYLGDLSGRALSDIEGLFRVYHEKLFEPVEEVFPLQQVFGIRGPVSEARMWMTMGTRGEINRHEHVALSNIAYDLDWDLLSHHGLEEPLLVTERKTEGFDIRFDFPGHGQMSDMPLFKESVEKHHKRRYTRFSVSDDPRHQVSYHSQRLQLALLRASALQQFLSKESALKDFAWLSGCLDKPGRARIWSSRYFQPTYPEFESFYLSKELCSQPFIQMAWHHGWFEVQGYLPIPEDWEALLQEGDLLRPPTPCKDQLKHAGSGHFPNPLEYFRSFLALGAMQMLLFGTTSPKMNQEHIRETSEGHLVFDADEILEVFEFMANDIFERYPLVTWIVTRGAISASDPS